MLFFFALSLPAQPLTNLSVISKLIENSTAKIDSSFLGKEKKISLVFFSVPSMQILKGDLINSLIKRDFEIKTTGDESDVLNYTIENISVLYNNVEKEGLFGNVFVNRIVKLEGEYFITENGKVIVSNRFTNTYKDTVNYDMIQRIENTELPFTRGEVPGEPLFSNLVEPAIALGALIVTIILFFTVRSR
ncbi:hypothetical protein ABRY23_09840 [Melioribacteraceae bacterium 4301-Me]|uniref:hypothetical protein n=1 Tax=Pyranulibacter aquaticus TaxID=3163344 RepID=UPI00359736DB